MLRLAAAALLAAVLAGVGLFAGWGADRYWASALLLHAEPLLLVLAVWAIAALRWTNRAGLSFGVSLGMIAMVAGMRVPFPVAVEAGTPPPWIGPVSRCAAALDMPLTSVRILQWTLDASVSPSAVRDVVERATPNVVVLHGFVAPSAVAAVVDVVGGEAQVHGEGENAVAVVTAGGFHPCGETLEWTSGDDDIGDGYVLSFVGVPPRTIVPLVVTRFPSPNEPEWATRMDAATARVFDLVGALEGASTVVVADAAAPRTFRHLDGGMAATGLSTVPLPPSWPARLGPVPLLTLHPYGRMWSGPLWRIVDTQRLSASRGTHAPVLAVLEGVHGKNEAGPAPAPRRTLDAPRLGRAPAGGGGGGGGNQRVRNAIAGGRSAPRRRRRSAGESGGSGGTAPHEPPTPRRPPWLPHRARVRARPGARLRPPTNGRRARRPRA